MTRCESLKARPLLTFHGHVGSDLRKHDLPILKLLREHIYINAQETIIQGILDLVLVQILEFNFSLQSFNQILYTFCTAFNTLW